MFANALRLLAALLITTPALAEEAQEPLLLAGIGAGAERLPYRGVETRKRVLPLVTYENAWVSVALPTVDLKLTEVGPVGLRLRTRFGFEGYKASDSPYLAGMDKRKGSLWLGPAAVWDSPVGEFSAEWVGDTMGHSKGSQWQLQYEKRFDIGALALTPRVAVHGVDRKYVDYYYGVRAGEATAARPAYLGGSTRQTEVGLRLTYRLDESQMLFADVAGTQLGKAVEKSPLLDRRYQASAFAGWLYRF